MRTRFLTRRRSHFRLVSGPLADEVKLETETVKNAMLRESLGSARGLVVPRVHSSSRTQVVMDYEPATLARDIRSAR